MRKDEAMRLFGLPSAMLPYLPDTLPAGITSMWYEATDWCFEVWYEQGEGKVKEMLLMKEPMQAC